MSSHDCARRPKQRLKARAAWIPMQLHLEMVHITKITQQVKDKVRQGVKDEVQRFANLIMAHKKTNCGSSVVEYQMAVSMPLAMRALLAPSLPLNLSPDETCYASFGSSLLCAPGPTSKTPKSGAQSSCFAW